MFNLNDYLTSLSFSSPLFVDYFIDKYLSLGKEIFVEINTREMLTKERVKELRKENKRVSIRYLEEHIRKNSAEFYQDRIIINLYTVCLDGLPFMLVRNNPREGDQYKDNLLLNIERYKEAMNYILSILNKVEDRIEVPEAGRYENRFETKRLEPKSIPLKIEEVDYIERAVTQILEYNLV